MDDQTLCRLFGVYILSQSVTNWPIEDSMLINEGLITKEKRITEKGTKFVEGLDVSAKMKLVRGFWSEAFWVTYRENVDYLDYLDKMMGALQKLIKSLSLEELPIFLTYEDFSIRKIAAEAYKTKKEVER